MVSKNIERIQIRNQNADPDPQHCYLPYLEEGLQIWQRMIVVISESVLQDQRLDESAGLLGETGQEDRQAAQGWRAGPQGSRQGTVPVPVPTLSTYGTVPVVTGTVPIVLGNNIGFPSFFL